MGQLEGFNGQPEASVGQPEGSEGQSEGSEGIIGLFFCTTCIEVFLEPSKDQFRSAYGLISTTINQQLA